MKKELANILKGAAGVGVALGGATAFDDSDIVYAAELEETPKEQEQEDLEFEQSASALDSEIESLLLASESASESVADSVSVVSSTSEEIAKAQASESDSLSLLVSEVESLSVAMSEAYYESVATAESELVSASEVASEAATDYDGTFQSFEKAGYNNAYFTELLTQIEGYQAQLQVVKETASSNGEKLDDTDYYTIADNLAMSLVKYELYTEKNVTNIESISWTKNFINRNYNYIKVVYKDAEGNEQTAYYDYVNVDANGSSLDSSSDRNDPDKVVGIHVYEKTLSGSNFFGLTFTNKGTVTLKEEEYESEYEVYVEKVSEVSEAEEVKSETYSTYESISESIALMNSEINVSTSESAKESNSISEAVSEIEDSLKESEVESESESDILSDSGSLSLSEYESVSEEIESRSQSAYDESVSQSEYDESVSASESESAYDESESQSEYDESQTDINSEVIDIEDDEVPLAVLEDDDEVLEIEDEETPLASNNKKKKWWNIIPIIAGLTGAGVAGKKIRDKKNQKRDTE